MACDLRDLQLTEYEILCCFADFCDKNSLEYNIHYGTLLGAIRHDGFIPWDDDVDVLMDYKSYKKFIKLYRKNPVAGFDLSWIDKQKDFPYLFAKLRKDGTHMPEESVKNLDVHNGVWIDIFYFIRRSKNPLFAKLQIKLYNLFIHIGDGLTEWSKNKDSHIRSDLKLKLFSIIPHSLITLFRRLLLGIVSLLSSKNSDKAIVSWWTTPRTVSTPVSYLRPLTSHKFEGREFSIPSNYDDFLKYTYGDYMTPVPRSPHVNFDNIIL